MSLSEGETKLLSQMLLIGRLQLQLVVMGLGQLCDMHVLASYLIWSINQDFFIDFTANLKKH